MCYTSLWLPIRCHSEVPFRFATSVLQIVMQGNPVERRKQLLRTYEMAVVMRGDLPEEGRTDQLDTIQGWIEANQGSVTKIDDWGRRRLAYEIRDQRDGFYSIITAELPAHAPAEIERNMHISDNILRYLIIREDE